MAKGNLVRIKISGPETDKTAQLRTCISKPLIDAGYKVWFLGDEPHSGMWRLILEELDAGDDVVLLEPYVRAVT